MSQAFRYVNEDAVWVCVSDKETERTLCAAKVEWEVSGVALLGAIVYYDTWRGGFPIMGEECYLTWLTTSWPKIFTFISVVPRCRCLSISNREYMKVKWNLDNLSQCNRVLVYTNGTSQDFVSLLFFQRFTVSILFQGVSFSIYSIQSHILWEAFCLVRLIFVHKLQTVCTHQRKACMSEKWGLWQMKRAYFPFIRSTLHWERVHEEA